MPANGLEKRRPLRRPTSDHIFGSLLMLVITARRLPACYLGCDKGPLLPPSGVADSLKATVEEFACAYEAASPDEQAALRAWMRNIVLPRNFPAAILAEFE
jgi:hypothetical protein